LVLALARELPGSQSKLAMYPNLGANSASTLSEGKPRLCQRRSVPLHNDGPPFTTLPFIVTSITLHERIDRE
jgi:hypothetical protein